MRRVLLSLALAMSISAVGASSALAEAPEGAQKAPLFPTSGVSNCPTGATPTAETFGFAVLNTPGNETALSGVVSLRGAAPNATYLVAPVQGPFGSFCLVVAGSGGLLHTNGRGNGTVQFSGERLPGATKFFVELVNLAPPFDEFASPAVELD